MSVRGAERRATEPPPFPRLAVIGDVGVERMTAGQLQLYRLLADYPPERLRVVTSRWFTSGDERLQLPNVRYEGVDYRVPRLVRNRLNPAWPLAMSFLVRRQVPAVLAALDGFAPEAILTVSHWFLWFAAAEVARRLDVPLHVILHDEWTSLQTFNTVGRVPDAVRWGGRRVMAPVYRQARSRLCVSPGMVDQYRRWFGVGGTVLYPTRGDGSPEVRLRVRSAAAGPPVVAFCGSLQAGTVDILREVALVLGGMGGHLDMYTKASAADLASFGLVAPVVRRIGFFATPAETTERVAKDAHALLVPASFAARARREMETLFPSKLADYTAMGVPILVWGPPYSSAARWAKENPGAVILVTDARPSPVREALAKVVSEPEYAARVALAGMDAGKKYFELSAARGVFLGALGGHSGG